MGKEWGWGSLASASEAHSAMGSDEAAPGLREEEDPKNVGDSSALAGYSVSGNPRLAVHG